MERTLRYIEDATPRAFLVENVVGLITFENGSYFAMLLERMKCNGLYNFSYETVNSLDHSLPQSRRRVYIFGVHVEFQVQPFSFPPV